jgi:hypothetical protein
MGGWAADSLGPRLGFAWTSAERHLWPGFLVRWNDARLSELGDSAGQQHSRLVARTHHAPTPRLGHVCNLTQCGAAALPDVRSDGPAFSQPHTTAGRALAISAQLRNPL